MVPFEPLLSSDAVNANMMEKRQSSADAKNVYNSAYKNVLQVGVDLPRTKRGADHVFP
jgi:hypothetical protein